MEHKTVTLSWPTVRLIAALVAVVCVAGIAAILVYAPRRASVAAPEAAPQSFEASVPGESAIESPGAASLAVPALTEDLEEHSPLPTPTRTATALPPTATATSVPSSTATPTVTNTPMPTPTPMPTETPTITPSPTLTATSPPTPTPTLTHTPTPTVSPTPFPSPTAVPPLSMDWVLAKKNCISAAQWFLEFWLTASGGTGEYTFYRDIERVHGPAPAAGFGYQMYAGTGSAVVGTFAVESGGQRVQSEFWIERLDCSEFAPPPPP